MSTTRVRRSPTKRSYAERLYAERSNARRSNARSREALTKMLILGAQLVAVALATAWLSRMLVDLSGTVLRLPPAWGQSVQKVMPLFGVAVFTFARHLTGLLRARYLARALEVPPLDELRSKARPTKQERGLLDEARKRSQSQSRTVATGVGVVMVLAALAAVFMYKQLHQRSAWGFTVPVPEVESQEGCWNWYWAEWGDGKSFPCDRVEQQQLLAELDGKLPPFLDRESGTLYLPLDLPEDIRGLLEIYGDGDVDRGRWFLLRSEHASPIRLIDALLQSPTYPEHLRATQLQFYSWHALVIALLALAVGALFAPTPRLAAELVETLT